MDPLFILFAVGLGVMAAYFLFSRRVKERPQDGRADAHERPELTGEEQYKRRDFR